MKKRKRGKREQQKNDEENRISIRHGKTWVESRRSKINGNRRKKIEKKSGGDGVGKFKKKSTCYSSKNYWYIIMVENESKIIMKFRTFGMFRKSLKNCFLFDIIGELR